ncbi:DUF6640 family protein [Actinomycetospora lemnae]|uniref:DUF4267 domain-containing protein n=1 Tax=Actinomycetospora lemnae TaxID=3019891 RepID=A0ABT5SRU8_9PSEU|nr:DUF6640 family protein [Actinomycetospora sp. DW7H6]MDD7965421.1 hypothetical protein [Actinomycetospora sp. DW7H6]
MSSRKTASGVLVGLVAAGTAVGALLVDAVLPETARQHMRNPRWPGHAKFHNAQYIVMSAVLGGLGLRLLRSPHGDPDHNRVMAAAIVSVPYLGMYGAAAFPGTALSDEEFGDSPANRVGGVEDNLLSATVCLAVLGTSLALGRRAR